LQKILNNPKNPNNKIRLVSLVKEKETEYFLQDWYDITKPDGYVNISNVKEFYNENTDNPKNELLNVSLRAFYNVCVDYIIKIS
jgi:type V secretory pathway adhesin AidA